jgi:hypothetical protein
VLLLVIGAIAGSGDDNDPEPTTVAQVQPTEVSNPTAEPTDEPEPTDQPIEEEANRCESVDDALVSAISEGLTVEGGTLRNVMAARSEDFENAYFVAADIQADGLEGSNDIGIWVTNDLDAPSSVYAVDEVAQEFSDWGDGGQTDAGFSTSDDGAQEARRCVEAAGE